MPGAPLKTSELIGLARAAMAMRDEGESMNVIVEKLAWPGNEERHAREGLRVVAFWDESLLDRCAQLEGAWHTLTEGERDWLNKREELHQRMYAWLQVNPARWPSVTVVRRWARRPPNHRGPGDNPEQSELF